MIFTGFATKTLVQLVVLFIDKVNKIISNIFDKTSLHFWIDFAISHIIEIPLTSKQ